MYRAEYIYSIIIIIGYVYMYFLHIRKYNVYVEEVHVHITYIIIVLYICSALYTSCIHVHAIA